MINPPWLDLHPSQNFCEFPNPRKIFRSVDSHRHCAIEIAMALNLGIENAAAGYIGKVCIR